MKKQKGITLISIVITILVLLILAGIAIAIFLGNNGILSNTTVATQKHKDSEAKQDITMAWGAINAEYISNNSKSKEELFTIENLNKSLETNGVVLELNYNSSDTSTLKYATVPDNIIYDMEIDTQGNVKIINTTMPESIENSNYLVDKVEIGDYVDIGINYTNIDLYFPEYLVNDYGEQGPTGWRVLSKNGKGITGTVTLVSAGCPIYYRYINDNPNVSMPLLDDLYKEIEVVELPSYNDSDEYKDMFLYNGFTSNNLKEVFDNSGYIDINKGIHGITTDEILTTYKNLTGKKKTFEELLFQDVTPPLKTSTLINTYENFNERANDLLSNGYSYWLKGFYKKSNKCSMTCYGFLSAPFYEEFIEVIGDCGVRPVLTLKCNLELDENNIGNGTSVNSAYTLKK